MTHSGFKTAQKHHNLTKKENNNKDYRVKEKNKGWFSSEIINFDYILRTKYKIYLTKQNINYLYYNFEITGFNPSLVINFEEHTNDENKIIQEEIYSYYSGKTQHICSVDKTHSYHSKNQTKNKNKARKEKWDNNM